MKNKLGLLLILITQISLSGQIENYTTRKLDFRPIVCELPASNEVNHHHVPYKYVDRGIKIRETEIEVRYFGPVPDAAKTAMNEVTRIISDLFPSDEKIIIELTYAEFAANSNSLAGASPESWYANFKNAPKLNAPYPVALAEKLARTQLNGAGTADITITVNQNREWYYNFNSPGGIGNGFDFVSVILHEVLHGLGFSAITAVTETNLGFVRLFTSNTHTAFVSFLERGDGVYITDLSEGTSELGSALTSNNLFYRLESKSEAYKIFAPSSFSVGSSISHLDEGTYNNTVNSLMTPTVNRGEIENDPGVATDMLYDLGWNYTYIDHNTADNVTEKPIDQDFILFATVESDSEIAPGTFKLHYSSDNFDEENVEVVMELVEGNNYTATIPAPNQELIYDYYFSIEDTRSMRFTQPGFDVVGNNQVTYSYTFGPDRVAPEIVHEPITTISNKDRGLDIEARVNDAFTGVDSVFVQWRINGVDQDPVGLSLDTENLFLEDLYKGRIILDASLGLSDTLEYKLLALDKGSFPNTGQTPRAGRFYVVTVVPSLDPVLTYANDFDTPSEDFQGDFTITTPSGFFNPALHSIHPYVNAGNGNTINYIAQLKIPIIVDNEYPIIEFDEVVLVEPGEPNVPFGEDEFWDYVIVEAKKFGGSSWEALLEGYDSRARTTWLSQYNAGVNGNDSQTAGTASMFFDRVIDMTSSGDFVAGDTIEIRFRLFSDPFAVGWGWCIDNLKIQELALDAVDIELDQELSVFPNPLSSHELNIKLGKDYNDEMVAAIFTIDGKRLTQFYLNNSGLISFPYDPGTYILRIKTPKGIVTRKILKLK